MRTFIFLSFLIVCNNLFGQTESNDFTFITTKAQPKEIDILKQKVTEKKVKFIDIVNCLKHTDTGMLIINKNCILLGAINLKDCTSLTKLLNDTTHCARVFGYHQSFSYNPNCTSTIGLETLRMINGYVLNIYPCDERFSKNEILGWLEIEAFRFNNH